MNLIIMLAILIPCLFSAVGAYQIHVSGSKAHLKDKPIVKFGLPILWVLFIILLCDKAAFYIMNS